MKDYNIGKWTKRFMLIVCLCISYSIIMETLDEFYLMRKNVINIGNFADLLCLVSKIELYPKKISWIADIISAYR